MSFYYLVVCCGVVISSHYCMDRMASSSLFALTNAKCGLCGMAFHGSKGCCREDVKFVKLQVDQQVSTDPDFDLYSTQVSINTPSEFIVAAFENFDRPSHFLNHSPPLISKQDTYLLNNVFRI